MPLLTADYISSLHTFKTRLDNRYLILDSFTQKQVQTVEQNTFLQGSLGTHIMNVGAMKWETELRSPFFIFDNPNSSVDNLLNILSSVLYTPNFIIFGHDELDPVLSSHILLHGASIDISETGINTVMNLVSDNHCLYDGVGNFPPDKFWMQLMNSNPIFSDNYLTGRIGRFYDVTLLMGDIVFGILSGNINIDVNIEENFFLNTGIPAPNFAVNSYKISGTLKVAYPVPRANFDVLDYLAQTSGSLLTHNDSFILQIGNQPLCLLDLAHVGGAGGSFPVRVIYSNVSKKLETNQIITATINFESYAA
jgi:hypothetical protein